MSAARVAEPKRVVSFPGDPAPLVATVYPCAFRYSWSAFTSLPREPTVRFVLNAATAALVTEPVVVPPSEARTLAIVEASALNDASTSRIACICGAERPEEEFAEAALADGVA